MPDLSLLTLRLLRHTLQPLRCSIDPTGVQCRAIESNRIFRLPRSEVTRSILSVDDSLRAREPGWTRTESNEHYFEWDGKTDGRVMGDQRRHIRFHVSRFFQKRFGSVISSPRAGVARSICISRMDGGNWAATEKMILVIIVLPGRHRSPRSAPQECPSHSKGVITITASECFEHSERG
ncbi:hypothetical protein C8R43DRAFT_944816 [Mycena crocata]|nr:hypothetical protein C8R43DRAFT_944816 [Mycena crocata]